jgi:asparaginyl-tRNA synthetase
MVIRISDIAGHVGKTVTLHGWVCGRRESGKKLLFLLLRDGSGRIQAVLSADDLPPGEFASAAEANVESSCAATGTVRADERAPGGFELTVTGFTIVGPSAPDYPVQPRGRGEESHGADYLLERRHLWLRTERQCAVMRLRDRVILHLRLFLDAEGFVCVDSPIITANACEGTSTLFKLDYFDRAAYLSQSGQLYSEATCQALGRVYCFGPTFRAEKSFTRKHLTEFWMLEPEAAFLTHEQNLDLQERIVKHVTGKVLEEGADLIEKIHDPKGADFVRGEETAAEVVGRLEAARDEPFARMTYDEALEKLAEAGEPLEWGLDFGAPHETALGGLYDVPVFVERWPAKAKAFYMEPDPEDDRYVQCDDLIASGGYGELIGASIRAHDPAVLERRIAEYGLDLGELQWYLDVRRYGSVPHGGFGLGLERFVQWLGGVRHIRETIPFPRTIKRLEP